MQDLRIDYIMIAVMTSYLEIFIIIRWLGKEYYPIDSTIPITYLSAWLFMVMMVALKLIFMIFWTERKDRCLKGDG